MRESSPADLTKEEVRLLIEAIRFAQRGSSHSSPHLEQQLRVLDRRMEERDATIQN